MLLRQGSPHGESDDMSLAASAQRPSSKERPHHARAPYGAPNATRLHTPNATLADDAMSTSTAGNAHGLGEGAVDSPAEEDPRTARWREHYLRTEARLNAVLGGTNAADLLDALDAAPKPASASDDAPAAHDARPTATPKKAARAIDEDDYGDDEDDEDEDDAHASPLLAKSALHRATFTPTTPQAQPRPD